MITHFRIANLTCESCIKLCTMKLTKLPGVQGVTIDLATGNSSITSLDPLTLEQLAAALAGTHYEVHPAGESAPPAAPEAPAA